MEVSSQLHAPVDLPRGKSPGIEYIGGWVGPRSGLDFTKKREDLLNLPRVAP
jgi:hypothetical protein